MRRSVYSMEPGSIKVFQAEVTNHCNAACWYCPHRTHERARGFMSEDTFRAVLRACANRELGMHHFGEPLLHPDIVGLVHVAAQAGFRVGFSTNGEFLTQELLDELARAGLAWLRLHTDPCRVRIAAFRPPAGLVFTEHTITAANDAPVKPMVGFSGHIPLEKRKDHSRCSFLRDDWCVVLWDGSIAMCCHDIEGICDLALCKECEGYVFKGPADWCNYDG